AVEIDAVGVLARACGDAVGIEVGHDPELDAGDRRAALERPRDADTGGLVAVDAPDDERHALRARVAARERPGRSPADRAPHDDGARRGGHRGAPGPPGRTLRRRDVPATLAVAAADRA